MSGRELRIETLARYLHTFSHWMVGYSSICGRCLDRAERIVFMMETADRFDTRGK